jgi:hypothetical protein
MEVFAVLGLLLLADVLGMRFGADSRDGRDWQPHRLRRAA